MIKPLLLEGMYGLGDTLYQRAIIREVQKERPVYLRTPWPQIYEDLQNVHCVKPATRLRTQAKNAARPYAKWSGLPVGAERRRFHYVGRDDLSILQCLAIEGRLDPNRAFDMSGPPVSGFKDDDPYVVVRPATVREEWRADARNPLPEYIAQAAEEAKQRGYRVISVADLAPGVEWALDPLPEADVQYHRGELNIEYLLALVANASAVIGGVGWIVPAALAYNVPLFLIYGGWGYYNHSGRIFGPGVDTSRVTQVVPDNFCMCRDRAHPCDKRVLNYDELLAAWTF